jgi:tripartite-type tricarboxylate transporter receptor subunit TctC
MKAMTAFGIARACTVFLAAQMMVQPAAEAQTRYPDKSVRVVVPAPPGSAPDFLVRLVGQKLGETWGQPVVIDNVVGASGNIGTERVAKATPDGYTLLFNTIGPIAVNQSLFDKLPYDPIKDLAPISLVAKMPNILTVNPGVPVKNLAELIALAKKEPGKLRYGTAGPGTTQHLSGELLNTLAGIKLVSVPYKSSAQMTTDALGGQIEVLFHNAPVLLPHLKSGGLRGIAITSARRSPAAAELPTMAEAGVPDFEITAWFGFMAPRGTPQAIIAKIHADVARIVATPEIQERILAQASEPVANSPEEYAAFISAEVTKWRAVIKQANMKAE